MTNEKKIWDYLKSCGLSDAGVAGLMGNLYAESALRPNNLQNTYEKSLGVSDDAYTAAVDDGSYTNFVNDKAGYGLAQWTYWSRKENLYNFAKQHNTSIGDLQMQLEFLWWELSNNYKTLTDLLKTTNSVQEASNEVLFKFERPANQDESVQTKRASYGQKYYDAYVAQPDLPVFVPRTTAPAADDKHWIHTSAGGLNSCILIENNSCLPNCVGYAWGRFYEIIGKAPKLSRANAENWYVYADGYERSQTPALGAVICWRKGEVYNGSDGAGHVAIVEEIKENGDVVCSNSGYKSTRFWMQTFTKASGYSMGSAYTFQGFILPPITFAKPTNGDKPKMKYNSTNKPLECMQTQSTCYKGTTTMEVKGILWHSTGANNPTLKRYVQPSDNAPDREKMLELLGTNKYNNDWNHIERQAGLNAWIGKLADGTVTTVQTMPWNYKPWGCGSGSKGSCNSGWIQFEICEDDLTSKEYFEKVYTEACELTAYLCHMFNIDPKGTVSHNGVTVPTILCHADSYKLKLGSNHGDVNHWFPKYDKTMEDARDDVAALLATIEVEEEKKEESAIEPIVTFHVGDTVKIKEGATYYSGKAIPSWVMAQEWIVSAVQDERIVINKSTSTASAINSPVHADNLILVACKEEPVVKVYYRVRKSWDDAKSQVGAYTNKDNAIAACDKAGVGYSVYDPTGQAIYSVPAPEVKEEEEESTEIKIGDAIKLVPNAKYASGGTIPSWLFGRKMYLRSIRPNGNYVISTLKTGAVTGTVTPESVVPYTTVIVSEGFKPYIVRVTASVLNVRTGPSTTYKIAMTVKKNELYTIVAEKNGWGKLKSGAGWISLSYATKVK